MVEDVVDNVFTAHLGTFLGAIGAVRDLFAQDLVCQWSDTWSRLLLIVDSIHWKAVTEKCPDSPFLYSDCCKSIQPIANALFSGFGENAV